MKHLINYDKIKYERGKNIMKKIIKILSVAFVALALTGCMKLNLNIEVKADKTVDLNMELLAEEELFAMADMSAEDYVEEMKDELLDVEELKDAKVTPIEKKLDGSKWVGVSVEAKSQELDDVVVRETKIDGKDCLEMTFPMDSFNSSDLDVEDLGYSVSRLKKLGMEMNLTIKMPGKVTCNVGKVDGNTVTIDLLELSANGFSDDIVLTSQISSSFSMIIVYVVLGAIIVAGTLFYFIKKKKKDEEIIEINQIDEYFESEQNSEIIQDNIKSYCPNCGHEVKNEEVCPQCGYMLKK